MTKARKEHQCTLCGEPIPAGTEYERQTVWPRPLIDDGGPATFKAHAGCYDMWERIGDRYDWEAPDNKHEWRRAMAEEAAAT